MTYEVRVSDKAHGQIQDIYDRLLIEARSAAVEWFNGVLERMNSLAQFPHRCPRAIESRRLSSELRHLVYGDHRRAYRIIFVVRAERVIILEVRHAARAPFTQI